MDLQSSPLMGANPGRIQIPPLVAPSTLAEAAQMNPMQAMLAQYGLRIPSQAQIPQHFMFNDQPATPGFPNTGTYGAGFGAAHPALATGIENALMGAAMAPGGAPTAGQNIAQVAGSLTGVPQWRLQRRIGMTLAPLELAGSMQNILSQQAQAQGQLLSGYGELQRGYGYQMMGQGREMEAIANANRVANLEDMWNRDPKQAQEFMDANAKMIQQERLTNPMYYIYSTKGAKAAGDFAKLSAQLRTKYGQPTTPEFFYNVFRGGNKKDINAAMLAMKYMAPYFSAQAKAELLGYGTNFNPYTGQQQPGMTPEQSQQQAQKYIPIPGLDIPGNTSPFTQGPQTDLPQPFGNLEP